MLNICNWTKKIIQKYFFHIISSITLLFVYFFLISNTFNVISSHQQNLQKKNINHNQGNKITINIYDRIGSLRLKLISSHIRYSKNKKNIYLEQPNITIFNDKKTTIWYISSNTAKLNNEKILFLYGYVYVSNLINNIHLKSIITHQAVINLNTQDIISDKTTIIQGYFFYSIGKKMHTNLYTQTIKLIDNTYINYEIKHI